MSGLVLVGMLMLGNLMKESGVVERLAGGQINAAYLVPHATVRMCAMGLDDRAPLTQRRPRGESALQFAHLAGPEGRVHSFEFDPANPPKTWYEMPATLGASMPYGRFWRHRLRGWRRAGAASASGSSSVHSTRRAGSAAGGRLARASWTTVVLLSLQLPPLYCGVI